MPDGDKDAGDLDDALRACARIPHPDPGQLILALCDRRLVRGRSPRLRSPVSGWYRLTSINVVADSLTTNGKPAGQRSEPERDP